VFGRLKPTDESIHGQPELSQFVAAGRHRRRDSAFPGTMTDLRPGDIVAKKYRILRILGRGGMGIVAAAEHLHLETRVALKFMLPDAAAVPGAVERFLREARAVIRLRSPHIVTVYDVDRLAGGAPFIAMELLEGGDLAERLRRDGPLPPAEAAARMIELCRGLDEAHRQGVVHRDIKPANLFVAVEPDGRRVLKILDFGISKVETRGEGLTQSGAVLGSPLYMSPEQVRSTRNVDARSDVWAAGVVLYELLTGRVPFAGASFSEICVAILSDPPAPIPEAPAHLARVVLRCLEKDPARRFASAAELATALAPHVRAAGASTLQRSAAELRPRRAPRRWREGLAGLGAAALVAGTLLAARHQAPEPAPRQGRESTADAAPPPPPPEPDAAPPIQPDAAPREPDAAPPAKPDTTPPRKNEAGESKPDPRIRKP
jgi:eukaryotic-like serine/threonine-protein kinase